MAIQTSPSFKANDLEAIRYQLETTGYVEGTLIANGYDSSPAVTLTLDGKTLGSTIPCPPDATIAVSMTYAVFNDQSTAEGYGGFYTTVGFRDGSGNIVDEGETQVSEIGDGGTEHLIASSVDTTNQALDIDVSGTASDPAYFVGRVTVVCAKKGGLAKKYTT